MWASLEARAGDGEHVGAAGQGVRCTAGRATGTAAARQARHRLADGPGAEEEVRRFQPDSLVGGDRAAEGEPAAGEVRVADGPAAEQVRVSGRPRTRHRPDPGTGHDRRDRVRLRPPERSSRLSQLSPSGPPGDTAGGSPAARAAGPPSPRAAAGAWCGWSGCEISVPPGSTGSAAGTTVGACGIAGSGAGVGAGSGAAGWANRADAPSRTAATAGQTARITAPPRLYGRVCRGTPNLSSRTAIYDRDTRPITRGHRCPTPPTSLPRLPDRPPAPAALSPARPRAGARDRAVAPRLHPAAVRPPREGHPAGDRVDAGQLPAQRRHARRRGRRGRASSASRRSSSSASRRTRTPTGSQRLGRRRHRAAGAAGAAEGVRRRRAAHHRRVLLRVHRPRPLRHPARDAAAGSTWTTTRRCRSWPSSASATRRPGPTWSPRAA